MMVFKRTIIEERLAYLRETLIGLRKLKEIPKDDFLRDLQSQWAVEHGLHIAAEAIFDIGNHILVGHFGMRVSGYDLILKELSNQNVIDKALCAHFDKLGGFRNILVHDYLKVDLAKIHERLQNGLSDFDDFVRQIVAWLEMIE